MTLRLAAPPRGARAGLDRRDRRRGRGSGVAGLTTALHARAAGYRVLLVTKARLDEARPGGRRAASPPRSADGDTPGSTTSRHPRRGRGSVRRGGRARARDGGTRRGARLIELGARFDRRDRRDRSLTREGGHLRDRIAHAGGDATGAEISRALVAAVRRDAGIERDRERAGARPAPRRDGRAVRRHAARDGRGQRGRRRRGARPGRWCSRPAGWARSSPPTTNPSVVHRRRRRARAARRCRGGRPGVRAVPPDGAWLGADAARRSSRSSPRRCAARAPSSSTTRERFMAASTSSPTSHRATSSPRRSCGGCGRPGPSTSGSTPRLRRRAGPRRFPTILASCRAARHRPGRPT